MASIYRRRLKKGEVWYAQLRLRDGRAKGFNTKIRAEDGRNHAKALKAALRIQAEINAGNDPFATENPGGTAIRTLLIEYLAGCAVRLRPATVRSYRDTADRVLKLFGRKCPWSLGPREIERFGQSLGRLGSESRNVHLRNLRAFLNWTVNKEDFRDWKPPRIVLARTVASPLIDYYNAEECRRILEVAASIQIMVDRQPSPLRLSHLVAVMMLTGMRKMEAAQLRWGPDSASGGVGTWVDLEQNQIVVPSVSSKSHRPRYIPILGELRELLEGWPIPKTGRLFPFAAESSRLLAKWHEATARAGVRRLKLHCLRDTFAVNLLLQGIPWAVVGEILGHASVETTKKYYAAIGKRELQTAVQDLQTGFTTPPTTRTLSL